MTGGEEKREVPSKLTALQAFSLSESCSTACACVELTGAADSCRLTSGGPFSKELVFWGHPTTTGIYT